MTIKIKSVKVDFWDQDKDRRCCIVAESDWRKLMKLVKAVDIYVNTISEARWDAVLNALNALEKKK